MIVGSGVVYFEMLEQEDGVMEGFQLWLNLFVCDKMMMLWYWDILLNEIFEFMMEDGVVVCVIVGEL